LLCNDKSESPTILNFRFLVLLKELYKGKILRYLEW